MYDHSKTILFLDNRKSFLDLNARLLEHEGYRVKKAHTLRDADRIWQDEYFQVAIIDIRMQDDDDPEDISGLLWALKDTCQHIPKIILTAYEQEHLRETLDLVLDDQSMIVGFVSKPEGPDRLHDVIEKVFANHVRINWDLPIHWSRQSSFHHLLQLIAPETNSIRIPDRAAELEDLFRKLFFANKQITIGQVLRRGKGQIDTEVFAYGGNELRGQCVVSCGLREPILEEAGRFENLVPRGAGRGSTRMASNGFKESVRFSATAYRLVDGDLESMEPLSVYYRRHSADSVRAALEQLYQTSLAPWHSSKQSYAEDNSLQSLYFDWLGLDGESIEATWSDRMEKLCQKAMSEGMARIDCSPDALSFDLQSGSTLSFPNPGRLFAEKPTLIEHPVLCGVTHGRVDTDSVLVDTAGWTWLIGFSHVAEGPLLRDFVRLENAVKTYLLDGMGLPALHLLEQHLLAVDSLNETVPTERLSPAQEKIAKNVMQIRRIAAETAGPNLDAYIAGLLACALAHVATFDPGVEYFTRRELMPFVRSLLQAAMLYERLMGTAQPPEELPAQASSSLWIDEANKVVWVEGQQKDLTPQDFSILSYLFENAGNLCTRATIIQEALGEEEGEGLAIWERSRLNSAMSRLRRKIEVDPENPRYLITVRGHGYRLELEL
ncbi:MAG: DNA-binding response regulator [Chloroflexota bacterium]|nr:DNA-binding response regulator [Chloroflexota bacterium]